MTRIRRQARRIRKDSVVVGKPLQKDLQIPGRSIEPIQAHQHPGPLSKRIQALRFFPEQTSVGLKGLCKGRPVIKRKRARAKRASLSDNHSADGTRDSGDSSVLGLNGVRYARRKPKHQQRDPS
jgi:hypothetical protein